jgi:Family of unknown function (DUF6526)
MPTDASQNLGNHARFVPLYHFVALPIAAMNAALTLKRAVAHPSWDTANAALLGVALVIMFFFARTFALRVQDRVIRLEMRLRLHELLPPDLTGRIAEFTPGQLVAMRFASDRELPALARRVLDERLLGRKAIKKLIQDWQPDHLRA